jgi:N12 class adenine-specific DNA methylase
MYVVPNHLLEQFAREFMQRYPNARLLVASKCGTRFADSMEEGDGA